MHTSVAPVLRLLIATGRPESTRLQHSSVTAVSCRRLGARLAVSRRLLRHPRRDPNVFRSEDTHARAHTYKPTRVDRV